MSDEPKPMPYCMIGGIKIIASPMMITTVPGRPVRYHRKKRIQKKWIKRYGYRFVEVPRQDLVEIKPGWLVGHPETIAKIQAQLTQADQASAAEEKEKGGTHEEGHQAGREAGGEAHEEGQEVLS